MKNDRLAAALKEIREAGKTTPIDEEKYLSACLTVVDNLADLSQRVYICLPGGLTGNQDARWDRVRQNSVERCSCGNERVFMPMNPRSEFEASAAEPVVVAGDDKSGVYLKPVGGDKESTYMKLWIEAADGGKALAFMPEPFAPLVLSASMFSTQGFALAKLAEVLPTQTNPPIMTSGRARTPLFAIKAVDEAAGTVTIVLDKDVTLLTNEEIELEGHHH